MASTVLGGLATDLASTTALAAAERLREAAFGPAQERKLKELLGESIRVMLEQLTRSGELASDSDYVATLRIRLTNFLSVGEVASALVSVAIDSKPLPVERLREIYEGRGYDPDAFPATLEGALNECALNLARRVREEASTEGSPLNNLVEVSKLYGLETTLQEILRAVEPRGATVDELERESWARCKRRWTLVGVPQEHAEALAKNPTVGAPSAKVRQRLGKPVIIISAVAGSGKSLLLDRLMQRAIVRYREDDGAPLPVFLEAPEVPGRLREAITERTSSLGRPQERGVALFLDGLEEAGRATARGLLDEAHRLPDMWRNTTVVAAGRPIQELEEESERGETVELPELSEEESETLVRTFAGDARGALGYDWPSSLDEAVRRPFFATLVGLDMRDRFGPYPRSVGELLTHLGERSVQRAEGTVDLRQLRDLAVSVTDSATGSVRASEAGTTADVGLLRATGLVQQSGSALRFSLQILAEWFAALALELGEVDAEELASDFARLERWRYPLVMALANFGHERVTQIFEPIVRAAPAFASQVVDSAFASPRARIEDGVYEEVEDIADRFRQTMGAWVDGIGPLAPFFAPVRGDGSLGTLAISGWEGEGNYCWYSGPAELPEIVPFSRVAHTDLRFGDRRPVWQRAYGIERQAAWAWRYTFKDLRHELEEALGKRKLPALTPMLAREAAWRTAKDLLFRVRNRARSERAVALDDIESCLDAVGAWEGDWISMPPPGSGGSGERYYEVHHLVEEVRRLRAAGETEMISPVPRWDLTPEEVKARTGEDPNYIWFLYSTERLFERASVVIEEALRGYGQVVESMFAKLAPHMPLAATLPCRLLCYFEPERGIRRAPSASCYFEPLLAGEEIAAEIMLGEGPSWEEFGPYLASGIDALRPEARGWLRPTSRRVGESLLLDLTPVTRTLYDWLWRDLRYVEWVRKTNPWMS
jgi:hypothetical protein